MNNFFKYRILPLLIVVLIFIAGCSKDANVSGTNVNNTSAPSATAQSQQPAKSANRFAEVFDPSKDAGKLVVRFIYTSTGTDTKAGDSTIIKTPDGKVMLIDGSAPETANQIKKCLDALGIKKIDAIVASHQHIDHVGGLAEIINQYEVGKVYRSNVEYNTKANNSFLDAIKKKNIETVILKDGSSFDFGETKINIYSPIEEVVYPKGFPEGSTAFLNDNSVVLKMTYKDSTMLFPGDLYVNGETSLLERHQNDIQADIVKMCHHGGETSNSSPFIKAVQPKIAVATTEDMSSMSIYNAYRKNNAKAYVTAVDGNLKIVSNGTKEYEVLTEKDRTSNFLK